MEKTAGEKFKEVMGIIGEEKPGVVRVTVGERVMQGEIVMVIALADHEEDKIKADICIEGMASIPTLVAAIESVDDLRQRLIERLLEHSVERILKG